MQKVGNFVRLVLLVLITITCLYERYTKAQEEPLTNVVIPNGKLGEFRHGTLVRKNEKGELNVVHSSSQATHTHPGIDLVANCGSSIYSISDGYVIDVINNKTDRDFRYLGYMVRVKHKTPINGKDTYSIYLHMQSPPKVDIDSVVKAKKTIIGEVGETGFATGCHTHFEIRHFATRYLFDPEWNKPWNIYGKGDQRNNDIFLDKWENPVPLLSHGGFIAIEQDDIRSVDFLNFTYFPSLCTDEFGDHGIGKTVKVKNGEFSTEDVYYGVVQDEVIYGDLTGDGNEEAIIHVACGLYKANYGLSEIFIYTIRNGKAALLATLNEEEINSQYNRYYPKNFNTFDGLTWSIIDNGVKVEDGLLTVEKFVDGPHCCPENIATIKYQWNGQNLVQAGKAVRS